jgi:flavin reductase (DIM6/NTAB) family NADH-FMN oxidoreductase RutF
MDFDITEKHAHRAYSLLASVVCPRPIAWVTTLHENGEVNAAPFSFFNLIGDDPPILMFCPGDREDGTPKDTALNCRRNGEFVVHLVDTSLAEIMVATSASLPYGQSELADCGIELTESICISVPRIASAPAALECTLHEIWEYGGNRMVLGLIKRLHVRDDLVDRASERILTHLYQPIGRMASPDWYCETKGVFEIQRPC